MGPVCRMRRPSVFRNGSMVSKVSRSQPAKMDMLPVAARWQPPDTGHSIALPPFSPTFAASRLISPASVVDISAQILPGPTASISPSSPSITAAQACGLGRQVMTMSQAAIIAFGLSAHFAPLARKGSAAFLSRSRTVRS